MGLVRNVTVAFAALALAVVAVPSCDGDTGSSADCDYVVRRCRTYCEGAYTCDSYWGCCYDRCWYDCVGTDKRDSVDPPAAGNDTPATPPAPTPDAGTAPPPATGDFAVLCAPCTTNDECKGGGLCIQRGGDSDAGAGATGFCGHPCGSSADCPADFTCTEIGESKQCVPTSGACN